MGRYFTLTLLSLILQLPVAAQVKQEYLYNTRMPYGTLDIRTKISATTFYYLDEGKTFSFREKAPGVRTGSFVDMTTWDSSPYKEGNLRKKVGSNDAFIMNYRLLPPLGYDPSYDKGYPLIVVLHGAIERGNCYYSNCYHGNWEYDPNINSPPAPTDPDHQLLNNDAQLVTGGKEHLDARNRAGSRLPDDPSMPSDAFPGFVLMPQMLNVWDSLVVEDVIRIVRLHCEKYNIDENRIYIHGLSIGGYATYEAIKRAPWLFAAALPMSAVTEAANIFKNGLQNNVSHIPLWIFQGAADKRPSPAETESLIAKFESAGSLIRYTLYPNVGHRVWEKAYYEPDFFSWMLGKSKTNLHARAGITNIDTSKNIYPVLMLAGGFFAYQWEKDRVLIEGASSNILTVKSPGVYRARFSRVENAGANDWNAWSLPVTITGDQAGDPGDNDGTGNTGGDPADTGGGDDGSGDTGGTDDGGADTGGADDGGGDTGGTDDGGADTGGADDGGGDTGGADDGSGDTGGTDDGGGDTGGTDDGGGDTAGTDDGGGDTGGADDGGGDTGGTDDGGGDTGGTDDGGGDTAGTDDGGGDTGGADDGSGNTGGADDGGGNTGGTDDGGADTGGADDGGGDTGGADDGGGNTGVGDDGGDTGGSDDGGGNHVDNPNDPGSGPVTAVENADAFPVSVYPNPTDGRNINIHLSSFAAQDLNLELVDMLGHVVHHSQLNARDLNAGDINIPLALDDGMYILILKNAGQEKRRRVIVRK